MKKKLMIAAAAMTLSFSFSMTACAQPQTMPDGTVFDAEYYAQANPDVAAAFGTDANLLYLHYSQLGKAEGRAPVGSAPTQNVASNSADEFDAVYYAQHNPDVVAALGTDPDILYKHYIQYGKAEGRLGNLVPDEKAEGRLDNPAADGKAEGSPSNPTLDQKTVYETLISLKSQYPQGMRWTKDNRYDSKSLNTWGTACAAFAFMLSDAAFGDLPCNEHDDISNIWVGDMLTLNNSSHMVVVLEVKDDGVIVAEGNYNGKVNWGRKISFSTLNRSLDWVTTRYPQTQGITFKNVGVGSVRVVPGPPPLHG